MDLSVLNTKNKLEGHPLILFIPWLATAYAYIRCQIGSMTLTKGPSIKNLILYPLTRPNMPTKNSRWLPHKYQEGNLHSPLTIDRDIIFKRQTKDEIINAFIN